MKRAPKTNQSQPMHQMPMMPTSPNMAGHHAAVAQGISQSMQMQPSHEVGLQGHFANLNENFFAAQPYDPNER
jgi:hypothetical protein